MYTGNLNDKVLLTGGSGFLGEMIKGSLRSKGFPVTTLGRTPASDIACDLSTEIPAMADRYRWVVHNAGKAHVVPKTNQQRQAFFDVNVTGTRNLLRALEMSANIPECIIFISSVSVYGLVFGENIDEDHPSNAQDPYGQSKIQAEALIREWCTAHSVRSVILRLPLLAGKMPPGNLGAMINGMKRGLYFRIAKNNARKSMVMAEDVADILPVAFRHEGVYNLTDGCHPSFSALEELIAKQAGVSSIHSIPRWLASILGVTGDILDKIFPGNVPVTTGKLKKMWSTLTFDDRSARQQLGWQPRQVLKAFEIQ